MEQIQVKPKLVFFQYKHTQNMPEFVLLNRQQHAKCLSEVFEVVLIQEDCDYQEVCDKYQPDLALFEMLSGSDLVPIRRPQITNLSSVTQIPKLGFQNADAWCEARAGFISDMERWGIDTAFSICTTVIEHMPELADNLFVWPNFIDSELYRDYGVPKSIPVLFTGSQDSQYPWRRAIHKLVSEHYPSLFCPHRGYTARSEAFQMLVGEAYARTINASWFVPACGTVAKEVVRKHFEVPAGKACLITEKSTGLEDAGFIDMINCVFADEHDVLDKLHYLFQNPDVLTEITNAGFKLVHSRHTLKHRDQILQWFKLNQQLKPDQKIIQVSPFEPLTVVQRSSGLKSIPIISNGLHLVLLRQGDEMLWAGRYEEAERLYLRCLNYIPWMPEPKLKLALCNLYNGNPKATFSWLAGLVQYILSAYKAADPDPVEWAYFILCHICLGKMNEAVMHANQYPWLRHLELDRARWLTNVLNNTGNQVRLQQDDNSGYRRSIHQIPSRSLEDWVAQVKIMLYAARQPDLAEKLARYLSQNVAFLPEARDDSGPYEEKMYMYEVDIHSTRPNETPFVGVTAALALMVKRPIISKLRKRLADFLHYLEVKWGYFLPYHLSEMRNDEFFHTIRALAREEKINTALLIGSASGEGSTEALLAGIMENPEKPSAVCINIPTRDFVKLQKRFADNDFVKCHRISASPEIFYEELQKAVRNAKKKSQMNFFDIVLIDGSTLGYQLAFCGELREELLKARFILLDDINMPCNFENHKHLLMDPNYLLLAQNPCLRNGYAIFKQESLYLPILPVTRKTDDEQIT